MRQLAAYRWTDATLDDDPEAERLVGTEVTPGLFDLLGAKAALGRVFSAADSSAGPILIISHALWERRFGGDPRIIGRTVRLNEQRYVVVGVMPQSFEFPAGYASVSCWMPLEFTPAQNAARGTRDLDVIGRLKPRTSLKSVQQDFERISAELAREYPDQQEGRGIKVQRLEDTVVGDVRSVLYMLFGASAILLLITCANVGNLQLSQLVARQRDAAIRVAVGASRTDLARLFLVEGAVLALVAAMGAVAFGWWSERILVLLGAQLLPRASAIHYSTQILMYTVVLAIGLGVLLAAIPFHYVIRGDALGAVASRTSRTTRGLSQRGLARKFIAGEVALAVLLLSGAGLMYRTVAALQRVDTGMRTNDVLVAQFVLPPAEGHGSASTREVLRQVVMQARQVPTVREAALIQRLPLDRSGFNGTFAIEGRAPDPPGREPLAEMRIVSPGFFSALGITMRRGRDFTLTDNDQSLPVVIANASLIREYFGGRDPIGARIRGAVDTTWRTVVGVVDDVRETSLTDQARPQLYVPVDQVAEPAYLTEMNLVVATNVQPTTIASAVRGAVHKGAAKAAITDVRPMEEVVTASMWFRRLSLWLLSLFATAAFLLASAGVYGMLAYDVSQRMREFGIRAALGASPTMVAKMVLADGLRPVLLGILVGAVLSRWTTLSLQSLLYNVQPSDFLTLGSVLALLLGGAIIASLGPVHRASSARITRSLQGDP